MVLQLCDDVREKSAKREKSFPFFVSTSLMYHDCEITLKRFFCSYKVAVFCLVNSYLKAHTHNTGWTVAPHLLMVRLNLVLVAMCSSDLIWLPHILILFLILPRFYLLHRVPRFLTLLCSCSVTNWAKGLKKGSKNKRGTGSMWHILHADYWHINGIAHLSCVFATWSLSTLTSVRPSLSSLLHHTFPSSFLSLTPCQVLF